MILLPQQQCRDWRRRVVENVLILLLWSLPQVQGNHHEQHNHNTDLFVVNDHDDGHHHDHHHHDTTMGGGCGAQTLGWHEETIQQLRLEHAAMRSRQQPQPQDERQRRSLIQKSCRELCRQCITVKVRLHLLVLEGGIVPHPTATVMESLFGTEDGSSNPQPQQRQKKEDFSSPADIAQMFRQNVKVLNQAYRDTPFEFDWNGNYNLLEHEQATWSALEHRSWLSQQTAEEPVDARILNVYVAFQLLTLPEQDGILFGFSTFPDAQTAGDGVYLRYDVLTGGGLDTSHHMDAGYWFVHEVGHFLGVLHVFQTFTEPSELYQCQAAETDYGDFVDDTPLQRGPSVHQDCKAYLPSRGGTPALPDTCPHLPGKDALFNYMNYVDDHECWAKQGEFTCGQLERMYAHWTLFREHVTFCNDDEMELELVVVLDGRHGREGRIVLLTENNSIVYDSFTDQHYSLNLIDGPILIDLCIPRSASYTLAAYDSAGNGFEQGGKVEIYVDRILVDTVEGNFGPKVFVPIGASTSQPTPSLLPEVLTEAPSTSRSSPTPSALPSVRPSSTPSQRPSTLPSLSLAPSEIPTSNSSQTPSTRPSSAPTESPTTKSRIPSTRPSAIPSFSPSLSGAPSNHPSTTDAPTMTLAPVSAMPSREPTMFPSSNISSLAPSIGPSTVPSDMPSLVPSMSPTRTPTSMPTDAPSFFPSDLPSQVPSALPSTLPTFSPTVLPTALPTVTPTALPSALPTSVRSAEIVNQSREEEISSASLALKSSLAVVSGLALYGLLGW